MRILARATNKHASELNGILFYSWGPKAKRMTCHMSLREYGLEQGKGVAYHRIEPG